MLVYPKVDSRLEILEQFVSDSNYYKSTNYYNYVTTIETKVCICPHLNGSIDSRA